MFKKLCVSVGISGEYWCQWRLKVTDPPPGTVVTVSCLVWMPGIELRTSARRATMVFSAELSLYPNMEYLISW